MTNREPKKCPVCGCDMIFMYGCGCDYDRWVCHARVPGTLRLCDGEVELEETTYPDGDAE